MAVVDANGKELEVGDSVIITQNLKVKGAKEIKRGAVVKNIRLTEDDEAIEGKVDGVTMVIKTIYVKKK
jgi:protein PhnA